MIEEINDILEGDKQKESQVSVIYDTMNAGRFSLLDNKVELFIALEDTLPKSYGRVVMLQEIVAPQSDKQYIEVPLVECEDDLIGELHEYWWERGLYFPNETFSLLCPDGSVDMFLSGEDMF